MDSPCDQYFGGRRKLFLHHHQFGEPRFPQPVFHSPRAVDQILKRAENICAIYFGAQTIVLSAVGKFPGTGIVTLPVAAHSAPRSSVVMNPTSFIEISLCPIVV